MHLTKVGESPDRNGQASAERYRGRPLPVGMTKECFDELEAMFVAYERGDYAGFASDAAIQAFLISRRHQA